MGYAAARPHRLPIAVLRRATGGDKVVPPKLPTRRLVVGWGLLGVKGDHGTNRKTAMHITIKLIDLSLCVRSIPFWPTTATTFT
jgi:hypothetical protein